MINHQDMLDRFDAMSGDDLWDFPIEPDPSLDGFDVSKLSPDEVFDLIAKSFAELGIPEEEFE